MAAGRRARLAAEQLAREFTERDDSAWAWPLVYRQGFVQSPDERTAAAHLCHALLGRGRADVDHTLRRFLQKARETAAYTGTVSRLHASAERLAARRV